MPEIVVVTPPGRGTGKVPPVILAAAAVCGITRVIRVGGAQAIAALAYGTESVPRVAKIVGPGNLFVTLAKQQVFGDVGIDGLPGPTETMVIADDSADPCLAAADLLAQAEHDVLASAILVTPSRELAERVAVEVARQMEIADPHGDHRAVAPQSQRRGDRARSAASVRGGERVRGGAPVPAGRESLGLDRVGAQRGRDLPGRKLVRGAGRLRGGAVARHADGRHGAVCLAAERAGFRQDHQPDRAGGARRLRN